MNPESSSGEQRTTITWTALADMNCKTATTLSMLLTLSLENASVPSKAAQKTTHGTLTLVNVLAMTPTNAMNRPMA